MRILLLLACGGEAPIAPAPVAPVDPPEPEVVARLAVPEPQAPALVRRWTEPSPPVPAQPGGVWRVHHGVSEPIGATTGPAPQEGSWGQEVQVTDAAGQLAWRAVDRWAMQPGTEPIPDHWLRIEAVGARPAPPLRLIHEGDVAQLAALARDGGPLIETTARVAGAEAKLVIDRDGRVRLESVAGLPAGAGWVDPAGERLFVVLRGGGSDVLLEGRPAATGWELVASGFPDVTTIAAQLRAGCAVAVGTDLPLEVDGEAWAIQVRDGAATLVEAGGDAHVLDGTGTSGQWTWGVSFGPWQVEIFAPDPRQRAGPEGLERLGEPAPCFLHDRHGTRACTVGPARHAVATSADCRDSRLPLAVRGARPDRARVGTLRAVGSRGFARDVERWEFVGEDGATRELPRALFALGAPPRERRAKLLERADGVAGWVAVEVGGWWSVVPIADHPWPGVPWMREEALLRSGKDTELAATLELSGASVPLGIRLRGGTAALDVDLHQARVSSRYDRASVVRGEPALLLEVEGAGETAVLSVVPARDGTLVARPTPQWFETLEQLRAHLDTGCGGPARAELAVRGTDWTLGVEGQTWTLRRGDQVAAGRGTSRSTAGDDERFGKRFEGVGELELQLLSGWDRPPLDPGFALWQLAGEQPIPCTLAGSACTLERRAWVSTGACP